MTSKPTLSAALRVGTLIPITERQTSHRVIVAPSSRGCCVMRCNHRSLRAFSLWSKGGMIGARSPPGIDGGIFWSHCIPHGYDDGGCQKPCNPGDIIRRIHSQLSGRARPVNARRPALVIYHDGGGIHQKDPFIDFLISSIDPFIYTHMNVCVRVCARASTGRRDTRQCDVMFASRSQEEKSACSGLYARARTLAKGFDRAKPGRRQARMNAFTLSQGGAEGTRLIRV
ncbi:hypothetical protein F5148DRAFT_906701 [Russula earlei]|uniref:Uncharacterized protein n=1 Tax=Russula earlei TaxID=71964 RepID=A0ACC0UA22_9AGAM|nr:hypothetical protein F5148DRAFT_906701 [Russula earlei]